MSYNSKYTGVEVENLLGKAGTALQEHQDISQLATKTELSKKQDTISDLATIRANAEKGATALQSVPSEYVTETELSDKGYATTLALSSGLSGKVDKDGSKVLSTNDFTNALKSKLESLSNYDDTTISNAVNKLRTDFDALVSGDTTTAIKTFNEVVAFLDGITDTQDLESIIASIEQQIAAKQDKISDLETIRQGAAKGATAVSKKGDVLDDNATLKLSSYGDRFLTISGNRIDADLSNTAGIWSGKFVALKDSKGDETTIIGWYGSQSNGLSHVFMGGSYNDAAMKMTKSGEFTFKYAPKVGNVSLVTTDDISGKADKASLSTVATSGSYNDLTNKPTIPSAVTESTVSGWGFTKNTGTYSKPSTGIPKTDLASDVQTSLGKADTALQTHQNISGKLDKTEASSTYLSKTDAASTYLGKTAKAASATTADSATKATQDGSGNVITSTYATKTELGGKVSSDGTILNIVKVTALPSSPDANTLYVIVES